MAPLPPLSRRALLGALGGISSSLLIAGCGQGPPESSGAPARTGEGITQINYADEHPDQYGVLGLPASTPQGLAVLVHGGFWFSQYGAGLMDPIAEDLRRRGYATWNIEYRRIGGGGGFPATFLDIARAFDKVPDLGLPTGLPSFSLGHSAGGHLAVWAASRTARTPGGRPRFVPERTISQSGVLDLSSAAAQNLGGGAAVALMGSRPGEAPADYLLGDPTELVPAQGRVLAVHAADDQIVPRDQSSTYVTLAQAAGGDAELLEVPGGHFDLIDTSSEAWRQIVAQLGSHSTASPQPLGSQLMGPRPFRLLPDSLDG